jgi:hypothetical protein
MGAGAGGRVAKPFGNCRRAKAAVVGSPVRFVSRKQLAPAALSLKRAGLLFACRAKDIDLEHHPHNTSALRSAAVLSL